MTVMLLAPFFADAALNESEFDASGIAGAANRMNSGKEQPVRSPIRSWSAFRLRPRCAKDGLPYAL